MSSKLIKGAQIKKARAYFLDIRDLSMEDDICRPDEELSQKASWSQQEIDDLINVKASEKAQEIARESRQAGFKKGYGEGFKKAEQEAAYLRTEAKDVLEQAKNIYREQLTLLRGDITALAVDIAEKLLGAQLRLDRDMVLSIAAEAIQILSNREHYIIYVNPAEAEIFESKKHELEKSIAGQGLLQVIADPGIAAGGCLVETEQGAVDASLEARWATMLEIVYGRVE